MTPKIRSGYREEATDRITEQLEGGKVQLDAWPAIITARVYGGENTYRGFLDTKELWVNKTRQLLAKYFDGDEFAMEFADRATVPRGYSSNPRHDVVQESLHKGVTYLRMVLNQIPDLELIDRWPRRCGEISAWASW